MMRVSGLNADQATAVLMALTRHSKHHFWPDSLPYEQVQWHGVMGPPSDGCLSGGAGSTSRRQTREFRPGVVVLHKDVAVAVAE